MIVMRYGVQNVTAKLNIDKKTNRPAGSAQLFLQPSHCSDPAFDSGTYLQAIIKLLDGKDFGGRPVRARSSESKSRASFGGGNVRYFGGDISIKCNNCGQVGHRQSECPQEPILPPCHFCAGTDHDPRMFSLL